MTEALRLKCPICGSIMRHVFGRTAGPQDATHHSSGRNRRTAACRLIVTPHVVGTKHYFEKVPDDVRVEALLHERRIEWKLNQAVGVA